MSLKSLPIPSIPEEVVRIAHAVFPRGNVFMQIRDTLGTIYADEAEARPVSDPWPTRFRSVAIGERSHLSIYGRFDRPPGR